MTNEIRLGHSPDSDDAFMFYAIAKNKIDTKNFNFTHIIEDIESLNKRAMNNELEITAISIHAYSRVYENYALLSSGASIGDNYGPIVVSKKPINSSNIKGLKIAVPGKLTTAYLALKLFEQDFEEVISPFDKIIDLVINNEVDAGLIIHEGQLLYDKLGLYKVIDLGQWWMTKENLPLPLGANAVRKDMGNNIKIISTILKNSIQYALNHRKEALDYAMTYAGNMNRILTNRFIGMYVNNYTIDFGEKAKAGVEQLLKQGYEKGIIKTKVPIEFY